MDIEETRESIIVYWKQIVILCAAGILIVLTLPVDQEISIPNNENILLIPKKLFSESFCQNNIFQLLKKMTLMIF